MISSIIDVVLLLALAGTSGSVLMMYRRLQRFDALQGQAAREFARSSDALDRAREALVKLQSDGGDMTVTLASRLNEARMVINDIEQATSRSAAALAAGEVAAQSSAPTSAAPDEEGPPAPRRGPRPNMASNAGPALPAAEASSRILEDTPGASIDRTSRDVPDPATVQEAATLGLGKPSAVDRIRAAARATAPQEPPLPAARSTDGETTAGAEMAQSRLEEAPAAPVAAEDRTARAFPADGSSHQRLTPPRTRSRWAKPGQQPAMSRWAAAAVAEGRLEPAARGPAVVNWREMARPAARPG